MKQIRNKVILSAIVLAFAIIATIGTTFAWFTISTTVQVENMAMYVTTQDNLLIRVYQGEELSNPTLINPSDYQTFISQTDIEEGYPNFNTYKLSPVTAVNETKDALDPQLLSSLNVITKELSPATFNAANGSFIELKFWVLLQSATDKSLAMSSVTVTANNGSPSVKDAVANAVFAAAWFDGSTNWEIYNADKADYAFEFLVGQKGYDSLIPANNLIDLAQRDLFVAEHTDYASSNLGTLVDMTPQLVVVRFYVEGWDLQATNNIIASQFTIAFTFEAR